MNRMMTRFGFVAFVLTAFLAFTAQPRANPPTDELKILFIGNSLTFYHDMPAMVAELAKAGNQRPIYSEQVTPSTFSLERHWENEKALTKIKSRSWDIVVIQDFGSAPINSRDSMFDYAKRFDEAIKKQGALTLLYMTWAIKDKPEDQRVISKAYRDLATEIKADIAPVGEAWETALLSESDLALYARDKKHPTSTGTYLAACVFYATIYGKSPEGLPGSIGKLTDEEALPLQAIAWKVVEREKMHQK